MNKAVTLSLLFLCAQPLSSQSTELYGQEFFESPPRNISIHNSYSNAYQRSYPVISLELPANAGANLERIALSQINGTERWKWGSKDLTVYSGFYNMRKRGEKGLATYNSMMRVELLKLSSILLLSLVRSLAWLFQVSIQSRGFTNGRQVFTLSLLPCLPPKRLVQSCAWIFIAQTFVFNCH